MLKINLARKTSKGKGRSGASLSSVNLGESLSGLNDYIQGIMKIAIMVAGSWFVLGIPEKQIQKKVAELDTQIGTLNGEKNTLQAEVRKNSGVNAQMQETNKRIGEITRKLSIINALDMDRQVGFNIMNLMSKTIPKKVWLETIRLNNGKIELAGASWELIPINHFLKILENSQKFIDIRLKSISSSPARKIIPGIPESLQRIKKFNVSMGIKQKG